MNSIECSDHPDAPHGFDRSASHDQDRYVCTCESWEPSSGTDLEYFSRDKVDFNTLVIKQPQYECPVHGIVDSHAIVSTIPGFEMKLCLICYLEKMVEIGVQKLTEVPDESR